MNTRIVAIEFIIIYEQGFPLMEIEPVVVLVY